MPGCAYFNCPIKRLHGEKGSYVSFPCVVAAEVVDESKLGGEAKNARKKRRSLRDSQGELVPVDVARTWAHACWDRCKGPGDGPDPPKDFRLCKSHFPARCFNSEGAIVCDILNLPIRSRPLLSDDDQQLMDRLSKAHDKALEKEKAHAKVSLDDISQLMAVLRGFHDVQSKLTDIEAELKTTLDQADQVASDFEQKLAEHVAKAKAASESLCLSMDWLRRHKDDVAYTFTGLYSVEMVDALFDWIHAASRDCADRFVLWRGARAKIGGKPRLSGRALSPRDQLFLTLFLLRSGSAQSVAAPLFGISEASVSRYFCTWVYALTQFFRINFPFPSQEETRAPRVIRTSTVPDPALRRTA